MTDESYEGPERIAIVGMACRYPGAENVDAFWRNLRDGVESITRFGLDELREAGIDPALLARPDYVPAFGALEGADLFDAEFFDVNPREAELMDPQHRLFLEQAWAALENAGCDPETADGPIGVFAGTNMNSYLLTRLDRFRGRGGDALMNRIRSDKDFLSTLASYKLNLRGPSMTVQTACSTGLVAVHLACLSLLDYQCHTALAGGVSVGAPLKAGYVAGHGVASPDGHCRAFDAEGDGMVGGSGVGVVVLKRLSDALADGDTIHAVILATAVNNDGAQKVGFTAPSVEGQIEVVALAHALAGVPSESITYVEAHGTATPLGDPVEVAALTQAFDTEARGFCALGSVKTNIGHTDAAAGIAGLIKTTLSMRHGQIPPSLHFRRPNASIDFANSPFFVADRLLPWNPEGMPRRAGVSAFGVGGTNAHIVLEEAPAPPAASAATSVAAPEPKLLVLSARTPGALDRLAADTAAHLEAHPALPLADVAFTLARGRKAFPHRRAFVASTPAEAAALLRGGDGAVTAHAAESDPGVAFLFSGLGTQYAGMGRALYDTEPAFREAMDRCFAILREGWGMDLAAVLYPPDAPKPAAAPTAAPPSAGDGMDLRALLRGPAAPSADDPLQGARWGHPAMFAVGYALAETWKARGIVPRAVAGHSLGEYVAACVAGVFSLEDALALVMGRAQLLDGITGAMAAVSLSEAETEALVAESVAAGDALWLAAVNAPGSCVVSGSTEAVARFTERAKGAGALVLPLAVRHPFHSGLLAPAREAFTRLVASIPRRAPSIRLAANATGTWLRPEQARSIDYWVDHLLGPVRFAACVDTLRSLASDTAGEPVLLEVGPGAVLGAWARQQGAARVAASLRHAEQAVRDESVLLRAVGQLWSHGVSVDWNVQMDGDGRHRVALPGHPLDRRRYWLDEDARVADAADVQADAAARRPLDEWFYAPLWRQTPAVRAADDVFRGQRMVVFGGAAAVADRLRRAGADVVRVEAGDAFRDADAHAVVRPGEAEDFRALADSLAARGWSGAVHTLHLWGLDAADAGPAGTDAELARGLYALLHWTQAQSDAGLLAEGSTVLCATRGAQSVLGDEALRPGQAPVAALLKVVEQEYDGVRCRAVDLPARPSDDALLAEAAALLAGGAHEPDVAYRGRARWTPFYDRIPAEAQVDGGRVPLREGGVYLVTGGLGGIGLAVARHLAEHARARLVLTGRRGLPPRDGWTAWVDEHGEGDATSRRILAVRELEALGAEVRVAAVDVTDAAAMRALVAETVADWGGLHGVVHAARVNPGGLVQTKTAERLAEVLAPRVAGTLALADATDSIPLDFLLLCSSLNALYGGVGALDESAASAFLDAFAAARAADGQPVVSVGWDGWTLAGHAENAGTRLARGLDGDGDDGRVARLLRYAAEGITPAEGAQAFGRVLAQGMGPRVAVCTRDLPALVEQVRGVTRRDVEAAMGTGRAAPGAGYGRPDWAAPYVEPRSELEAGVAALYERVLGVHPIGADDDFFEIGGDSLLATQLLSALGERFGVGLPLRDLFAAPTPARLAVAIVQSQAEMVDDDLLAQVMAEL
ncbi:MAG TPA: SDR family oxidoreductase [Longimicrobium sp.]|nr:SDR family oxidoreductase [Longimicrobium sp.]